MQDPCTLFTYMRARIETERERERESAPNQTCPAIRFVIRFYNVSNRGTAGVLAFLGQLPTSRF